MSEREKLKRDRDRLIQRNEEIAILKRHPKFRVITPDTVKEFAQLDEEEKNNILRIKSINRILRQLGE